ncbi:MAG TPA: hypothetical protein VGM90_24890 [Kofleriaceae bacterium]|jgi:hypothetical protein
MKWFPLVLLLAYGCDVDEKRPSLEAGYACGPKTCGENEYCSVKESGSQCGVDEDAGIGTYQEYGWTCLAVPPACDGRPACICDGNQFCSVSDDGRTIDEECI